MNKLPLTRLLAATAALAISASAAFANADWMTDANAAAKKSKESGKPLLLDFTGSDWCPPCIMMKKQVLDSAAFKEFAKDSLVLLELDFPRRTQQPDSLKQQNEGLAEKYGIEGFPTFILVSPKGKELARNVGFQPGGSEAFIKWIKKASTK
ncbi:MAG: thioredoxin family protein [Chthoniobacterales bacterium]